MPILSPIMITLGTMPYTCYSLKVHR